MAVSVGFDGSAESRYAVKVAAVEARLRKTTLQIVYSALMPYPRSGPQPIADRGPTLDDQVMADMLGDIAEYARGEVGDIEVRADVIDSMTVAGTLIEQSRDADLLVVGRRGRGGFRGLLLGSTSSQVVKHSRCPVIVTGKRATASQARPHGRIVVGVDDTPLSQAALRFGFTEARLHGADLMAVRAWQFEVPMVEVGAVAYRFDYRRAEEEAEASLGQVLAGWREDFPDVTVIPALRYGDARAALLDASEGARMVVVASRGRGGLAGMLLGSTSHTVLHHAEVPVAVVNPRADR